MTQPSIGGGGLFKRRPRGRPTPPDGMGGLRQHPVGPWASVGIEGIRTFLNYALPAWVLNPGAVRIPSSADTSRIEFTVASDGRASPLSIRPRWQPRSGSRSRSLKNRDYPREGCSRTYGGALRAGGAGVREGRRASSLYGYVGPSAALSAASRAPRPNLPGTPVRGNRRLPGKSPLREP